MGMCFVPDCKHYSERERCSFFRFPLNEREKKIWIINIRRADKLPSKHAKVCSCHFKDNLKKNTPTIFERNKSKRPTVERIERNESKRPTVERIERNESKGPTVERIEVKKERRLSTSSETEQTEPNTVEFFNNSETFNNSEMSFNNSETSFNNTETSFNNSETPFNNSETPFNNSETPFNNSEMPFNNSEVSENPQFSSAIYRELKSNVVLLSCEKYMLMKEIDDLKTKISKLEKQPFGFRSIKEKNNLVMYYTGLPNSEIFELILKMCTANQINYHAGWKVEKLMMEDQLLLTLMKLKLNLGGIDLSVRFVVSTATVSNVVLTWIHLLHENVFKNFMSEAPSKEKSKVCLPACFESFKNCRMILECAEINTEISRKVDQEELFYNKFKRRNTVKALLGIAPNGVITYVSEFYPGCTSDREVFENSNVGNVFKPGDIVLADEGFLLSDLLQPEVEENDPQFTPHQKLEKTDIANGRILIKRAISRVKAFKITTLIPRTLFQYSSKIFQVCAALTNFQSPLLQEVQHM